MGWSESSGTVDIDTTQRDGARATFAFDGTAATTSVASSQWSETVEISTKDLPRGVSEDETIPSSRGPVPGTLVGGVVTPTDDVPRARTKA